MFLKILFERLREVDSIEFVSSMYWNDLFLLILFFFSGNITTLFVLQGHALETEECGNDTSWECQLYSGLSPDLLAARQDVKEEVGPGCQCGCVIHLSASNSKRLLAASTKICPRKALWLIQVIFFPYRIYFLFCKNRVNAKKKKL